MRGGAFTCRRGLFRLTAFAVQLLLFSVQILLLPQAVAFVLQLFFACFQVLPCLLLALSRSKITGSDGVFGQGDTVSLRAHGSDAGGGV